MGYFAPDDNNSPAGAGGGYIPAAMPAVISSLAQVGNTMLQNKYNKEMAEKANAMNRANQEWLLEQNKKLQAEQRAYDSPAAQMQRYIEAGLNPHLIYGNGSSAGNVFPISAGNLPPAEVGQRMAGIPDLGSLYLSAQSSLAQGNLARARVGQVTQDTALKSLQVDIAKTNPMLNPAVAAAVADQMLQTAELKAMQDWYMHNVTHKTQGDNYEAYFVTKIKAEVEAMSQKLGLNTADLAIKNKILESKEFENAVKEVQARWLQDSDITPEHIRQGLMLLLSKMLGK